VAKKKKAEPVDAADAPGSLAELGLLSGHNAGRGGIAWDWPQMIVRNALNMVDGHKGTGKSSVMASVAAKLCGGERLPESKSSGPKGSCLWFGSEESFGASVVPRWAANGGDRRAIHTASDSLTAGGGRLTLPYQEERLREMVRRTRARVIVADPFTALADVTLSTRDDQGCRFYLESLARVAHSESVTVILCRHLRKGRSGGLLEHGLGSVAIAAVCRSILRVERDPVNPSVCYLACVQGNYGKAPGVVPYSLDPKPGSVFTVTFAKRIDRELEEVLDGDIEADERDALSDAKGLLRGALKGGAVDAKIILEEAKKNGIGERTLRKAKAELKVRSKRVSAGKGVPASWQWELPAK
jgi:hypothetical protein